MPRLLYRSWKDHGLARTDKDAIRVLILGAGQAGETLVRDLRRARAYQPADYLDDDAKLPGSFRQGLTVLGRIEGADTTAPDVATSLLVQAIRSSDAEARLPQVEAGRPHGQP